MPTVGEPIEPEVWRWYYNSVGKGEAVIVDTWWQTENGGFLCSTKPAIDAMKPGSAGPGVPGIYPIIYDENKQEMPAGSQKAGNICIRNPWPGIFQTIWGDHDRQDRSAEDRSGRSGHAQDALRQDHASCSRRHFQSHGYRRHHYSREFRYRRADSRACAGPRRLAAPRRP